MCMGDRHSSAWLCDGNFCHAFSLRKCVFNKKLRGTNTILDVPSLYFCFQFSFFLSCDYSLLIFPFASKLIAKLHYNS